MSQIRVRGAKHDDLSRIEKQYGGPIDTVGDPFCDTTKLQETNLDWLLVAEAGQQYAGFLYWHLGRKPFFAPEVETFAHIREVQVLEEFQGRGIGRTLMVNALQELKVHGVQEIFLATAETNDVAKHLYESLGFNPFRKQIHYRLKVGSS